MAEESFGRDHFTPQIDCWEKRAKKLDFRVSMASEDSETSRHRAEELRTCIAELKKLVGIEDPKPAQPKKELPVPTTTTKPLDVQGLPLDSKKGKIG